MATNVVTDVSRLAEQLDDIAGDWNLFLSQLKVSKAKREQIMVQHKGSPSYAQHCLLEGLEFWVASDLTPTYQKIISALKSKVINNQQLASEIAHSYGIQEVQKTESIPGPSGTLQPSQAALPNGSQAEKIKPDDILPAFKQGNSKTYALLSLLKRADTPVPKIVDSDGKSLLHLACRHSYLQWRKVVKALVHEHGCDLSATDNDGNTPLHEACGYNNKELTKYLLTLKSCRPNIENCNDETPLHVAISKGSLNIVRILLASGLVNPALYNPQPYIEGDATVHPPDINPEIQAMLDSFNKCVKTHNSSPQPYPRLTCCVLIALLETFFLKTDDDTCTLHEIMTESSQQRTPLPFDDIEEMWIVLSHIKHRYIITEKEPRSETIVAKYPHIPTAYNKEDANAQSAEQEILETSLRSRSCAEQSLVTSEALLSESPHKKEITTSRDLLHSFKQSEDGVLERLRETEQEILERTHTCVEPLQDPVTSEAVLSEKPQQKGCTVVKRPPDSPTASSELEVASPDVASVNYDIEQDDIQQDLDSEDIDSDITRQLIREQPPRSNRLRKCRDCCSSCGKIAAVCCVSCLVNAGKGYSCCAESVRDCCLVDLEIEDESNCCNHAAKLCCFGCYAKHPRCAMAVILSFTVLSIILAMSLLLSTLLPQTDNDGAILIRPNETVLVRNEGFSTSMVDISKVDMLDPHVVQFYLQQCNELMASELTLQTDNHLQIVEETTLIDSHYLLVGSMLTYTITLNGTIDERRTKINVFDNVEDQSRFVQFNITPEPLQTVAFSSGTATFTLTAPQTSYYFIHLYTPLQAMPTSINYQVNGTFLYYDPANIPKVCQIRPEINTSCSISLGHGPVNTKNSLYCLLSQVQPLESDEGDKFLNLTYYGQLSFNSNIIAEFFFSCLFFMVFLLTIVHPLCVVICALCGLTIRDPTL